MNKDNIATILAATEIKDPETRILPPGTFEPGVASLLVINLLQKMYTEHALTKNQAKLTQDIAGGSVLPWFATRQGKLVATASLVQQPNGWELGRAVSLDQGNGVGKRVMLSAALHHAENHSQSPLLTEVRVAQAFEGIPSGEATQKICFEILEQVPHAIAPLFAHGDPLRHENFVLAASDLNDHKTIREHIHDATNGRSTKGRISPLKIVQQEPFNIIVPDDSGEDARVLTNEVRRWHGTSLFVVEATDRNMPLIGMFANNPQVILCGTDRQLGPSGKPIILIASIGSGGRFHQNFNDNACLAPSHISQALAEPMRRELQEISEAFDRLIQSPIPESLRPGWSGSCY